MMRFLYALIVILALAAGWKGWTYHKVWHYLDEESFSQSYGAAQDKAKITIITFVSYVSRPCKDVNSTVMNIVQSQPDTRIIFHVLPGGSFTANETASIALAAGLQGKFADMHQELMNNEKPLTDDRIRELAARIKVDPDRLLKDMNSPAVSAHLRREEAAARALHITMAPLYIFNRRWIFGPNSMDTLYQDFMNMISKARKA